MKTQHYPPGTQKKYKGFSSRNLMMEKCKELEFPEGRGGLESASRILMKGSGIREADSDDRGFPLPKLPIGGNNVLYSERSGSVEYNGTALRDWLNNPHKDFD